MNETPCLKGVVFESAGSKLLGALYCPSGAGPHPTVILLHGLPGLEKNGDLAYALKEAGWNALIFHYRGCWGSGGDYTLAGIPEDIHHAVDHLLGGDYDVDPKRLAVIGHSVGGWAALVAASRDQRVRAVITLNGITNTRTASMVEDQADDFARFLRGITARGLQSQWRALSAMYNPVDLIADIEPRPMLLIHGTADKDVPESQALEFKQRAGACAELFTIKGADHWFSGHRIQLTVKIVSWLKKLES
jgi:hypothetical protein